MGDLLHSMLTKKLKKHNVFFIGGKTLDEVSATELKDAIDRKEAMGWRETV